LGIVTRKDLLLFFIFIFSAVGWCVGVNVNSRILYTQQSVRVTCGGENGDNNDKMIRENVTPTTKTTIYKIFKYLLKIEVYIQQSIITQEK
jgi:hypothetical protein